MHEKLNNYLNRPSTLFLACREGRISFIKMIVIFAILVNMLQSIVLSGWHEFHKGVILTLYIIVYFGVYAIRYMILSSLLPDHYNKDTWTIKKEIRGLLPYILATACITQVYVLLCIEEYQFNLISILQLQLFNSILGIIAILTFGFYVDKKLKLTVSTGSELPPVTPLPAPTETPQTDKVIIPFKNNTVFDFDKLQYIESSHNDVRIFSLQNGVLIDEIQRGSLSELELLLADYPKVVRCHDSFMVNLTQVQSWSRENDNIILKLKHCSKTVTVSRSYVPAMLQILNANSIPKEKKLRFRR